MLGFYTRDLLAVSKTRGFAYEIHLPCVKQAFLHTASFFHKESGNLSFH